MEQDVVTDDAVMQVEDQYESDDSGLTDTDANAESDHEGSLMVEAQSVYSEHNPFYSKSSKHPATLVESTALASIDINYRLHHEYPKSKPKSVYEGKKAPVSNEQIQATMLMQSAHRQFITIEGGRTARQGFINGDGPGVGKTRELCFGIKEDVAEGFKKHVWITTSDRLVPDIKKELKKVKLNLSVIEVGKTKAHIPITQKKGIAILTYQLLCSGSRISSKTKTKKGRLIKSRKSNLTKPSSSKHATKALQNMTSRYKQLTDWMNAGKEFEGLLILDECHSAKAFYQESTRVPSKSKVKSVVPSSSGEESNGENDNSKADGLDDESKATPKSKDKKRVKPSNLKGSKTYQNVVRIQNDHPKGKVVYSSATCASEIEHYCYLVRLGLWGPNKQAKTAKEFINSLRQKGRVAIEFLTMTLKRKGLLIARQLSFKGVKFEVVNVPHSDSFEELWNKSSEMWRTMYRYLEHKLNAGQIKDLTKQGAMSKFWATAQRYFKTLIYSSKIEYAAQLGSEFVATGKYAVVYGLQGTGESGSKTPSTDLSGAFSLSRHELKQGLATLGIETVESIKPQMRKDDKESNPDPDSEDEQRKRMDSNNDEEYTDDDDDDPSFCNDPNIISNKSFRVYSGEQDHSPHQSEDSTEDESDASDESEQDDSEETESDTDGENSRKVLILKQQMETTAAEIQSIQQSSASSRKRKRAASKSNAKKDRSCKSTDTMDTMDCVNVSETSQAENEPNEIANEMLVNEDQDDSTSYPEGTIGWSRGAKVLNDPPIQNIEEHTDNYMIHLFDQLENWLPVNPLDNLIRLLGGPKKVAEMTGRKVGNKFKVTKDGKGWKQYNRVNLLRAKDKKIGIKNTNTAELNQFQKGRKKFAVISDCASTGLSMHSNKKNPIEGQRIRKQIQLEFSWSPDKTIQQLGRTNRSNQVSPAEYILLKSIVPCEIRFESVVASRLKNLGASCHADGQVNPLAGLISDKNYVSCGKKALDKLKKILSSDYYKPSLKSVFKSLCTVGYMKEIEGGQFFLEPGMGSDFKKLLNRALVLPLNEQQKVVDMFDNLVSKVEREEQKAIKRASTMFVFDHRFTITELQLDMFSDAENSVFLAQYQVSRMMSWNLLCSYISGGSANFFWKSEGKGKKEIVCAIGLRDGIGVFHPWNKVMTMVDKSFFSKNNWKKVDTRVEAIEIWDAQHEGMKNVTCIHKYRYGNCIHTDCRDDWGTTRKNVLYGDILDVWSTVADVVGNPKIVKFKVFQGNGKPKKFVFGVKIPHEKLESIRILFRHLTKKQIIRHNN